MPILVSNVYPPDRGGIQTMMAALALAAASEGSVTVVAPRMPGSDDFDASQPYRTIRCAGLPRPFDALALGISFLRALTIVRDRRTYAANWWPSGLPLALVPRRLRGRLAIFAHGSDVAPGRGGARRLAMRWVFGRADAVLANSAFTYELLARAGVKARVSVIPLGVDVPAIEPARASLPTVLSVGRLVERKGFDRVIEALVRLARRFPEIRYEIVGDGPDRARLEALARDLGIAAHIVFHGKLSSEAMRAAYARAWCFALPVRAVGDDVEGFGIVYLEAAMARLPSVGGRDSGAADAIVDGVGGFLIDGNDVAAVGEAIATLLGDPDEAARMGERAFERARAFTWARSFECCKDALDA